MSSEKHGFGLEQVAYNIFGTWCPLPMGKVQQLTGLSSFLAIANILAVVDSSVTKRKL